MSSVQASVGRRRLDRAVGRIRLRLRRLGRWTALVRDERGATALEWTLLLAAIAIPSYVVVRLGVQTLIGHYQMITTLNALPFP